MGTGTARERIHLALEKQWPKKSVDAVSVDLPSPLSTNQLWVRGGARKTERYISWFNVAHKELALQKPGRVRGAYQLTLLVNPRHSSLDLDNSVKGVSDLLQEAGVIENDRQAERIVLEWSTDTPGCRAIVEKWTGPARAIPASRKLEAA